MGRKITLEESKNIRLSENFTLDEFIYSEVAEKYGIDNSMPEAYLPHIQYLVTTVLQPVRDKFGPIKVLSGYRSPELSTHPKIGSSKYSNHCFGYAADIEPYDTNIPLTEVLRYIHAHLDYKELIAEHFPSGWVHVAAQKYNNKHVLKLKDKTHHYTKVSIDFINTLYPRNKTTRVA